MSNGVCQYNPRGSFRRTKGGRLKPGDVQKAARRTSRPGVNSARHSYTKALHYTQIFFESMRSGFLSRQRLAWCATSCRDCVRVECALSVSVCVRAQLSSYVAVWLCMVSVSVCAVVQLHGYAPWLTNSMPSAWSHGVGIGTLFPAAHSEATSSIGRESQDTNLRFDNLTYQAC